MMKIEEGVSKYYDKLCSKCNNLDAVIYDSFTCQDILNETMIMAMKRFGSKDASEEEIYEYLKKIFFTELKFGFKRRRGEKLLFTDNLSIFESEKR